MQDYHNLTNTKGKEKRQGEYPVFWVWQNVRRKINNKRRHGEGPGSLNRTRAALIRSFRVPEQT